MSDRDQDVISNLRAIIISCKGGLPLVDVQNDYLEAFGEKVPIKDMGYSNLRELFERNPSEFYIFGDKVDVVTKSNSAHIKSLVSRQRGKTRSGRNFGNTKDSKKRHFMTYTRPPRFNRENSASTHNEYRNQGKVHSSEKVSLRKPKSCGTSELAQPALFPGPAHKTHSTFHENPRHSKLSVKIDTNAKTERSGITSTTTEYSTASQGKDTFDNIRDLPVGTTAQSRLLRHKPKFGKDLKSSDADKCSSTSSKSSEAKDMFFDVKSISAAPPGVLNKESNFNTSQKNVQGNYSHQKAQARIAQLQQSMQTLVQNMSVPPNEVNNNKMDNPSSSFERSFDQAAKSPDSYENFSNRGYYMDPSEMSRGHMGNGSTFCPPVKNLMVTDNSMYVAQLKELCNSRGFFDPSYKIIVREPKNEPKRYICKVQIEDYLQMSSYPIETQDPISAKELAAKKMYNYCVSDETFRKKNEDEEILVSRILDIVSSTYGVWSDKLPMLYNNLYQEIISENWFSVVSKSPSFEIENFDDKRCIIRKKTERSLIDLETIQRLQGIHISGPESRTLPDLELPNLAHWEIYITNVNNSDEVWCRLIGEKYSDAYDAVMTKLELEPPERKATQPYIDGLYSIKVSAVWYRVRLIEWISETQGLAFYIDIGDKDVVNLIDLYEPSEHYFSVAPQAVVFSLFELGCFSDDDELTSFITNNLLGNTYIGEIITDMNYMDKIDQRLVRLWDTSTERDVNVNQLLLNNIVKNIRPPTLPNTSQIKEVVVSAVSENGEVHVQPNQRSMQRLNCIILNKVTSMGENYMWKKTDDTIGTDILYLTKCARSGIFCRVKLIEIQNLAMVDVLFIDYGFIQRKAVSDLIHLEKSSILQAIPAQAIRVKLGNIMYLNRNVVAALRETILNETVLMKVISLNRGGLASVEFFKRSSAGSTLYSVNMKIKNDPELRDITAPARRKSVVVGLERVLPKNLPAPDLPEIGQHFEVFVTLASSPDLFIVQPLSSRMQLMQMMNDLQQMFGDEYLSMMVGNDIIVGELYAVLHPDGNWYRCCAQAIVGSYSYSVYMCDFGDCIMVTKDKLMPLPEKFKTFPYQAIRATLLGIPPEQRDWAPSDCVVFHKLVVEKYFVSTVMEITRDERNPNYINLGLILTDTSGDEDVYIHKVLMEKKTEGCTFMSL